ncbi:hypothetical protein COEREDRAFT_11222 [Coemansia reversa NRRL 1564]|uniref:Uncharacterized protein n=1 Tax=Coemansia reversa (strain ATCC 12441 / NRRL 1564) TaxID=763665 RepID=A0A2G5B3M3_COERN|nr:hypothetical protein COEREDRAFT_11222 [Coemansia reversa NRRL 1564]|eukprot:PIA13620.1 hypothetical protein COEREDRAFT_11222 [Coemansia reversa NRRL 1564]
MGWHLPQATREDTRPAQGHVHPQAQPNDTPTDPSQMEGAMYPTSQAIWNAFAFRNPVYLEHQSPTAASSESSEMTPNEAPAETESPPMAEPPAEPSQPSSLIIEVAKPKDNYDSFLRDAICFSGEGLVWSSAAWVECNKKEVAQYLPGAKDLMLLNAVMGLLTGKAKASIKENKYADISVLYAYIKKMVPQVTHGLCILDTIRSGHLFNGIDSASCGSHTFEVFGNMVPTDHNAVLIANALWELNPAPFANRLLDPDHVQAADMEQICHEFDIAHDLITCKSAVASTCGNRSVSSNKKKKRQTGSSSGSSSSSSSGNVLSNSGNTAPAASANTSVARTPAVTMATASTSSSKAYKSRGRTNIMLSLDGSLPIWVRAVVVGFDSHWDVLVGDKELTKLGLRRALLHQQSASLWFRTLCARLGLSADYFVMEHDAEFLRQDALYPEASGAIVKERLHHQCENEEQAEKLLSTLLTGKGAIHEYPGGCPPPAVYAPIQLPMHAEAKPIYVVQHMLSDTYGIDELSRAFTQLPIFTKSKPYTDEQCVLFDDSANNSLNMISVSMQLPMPMERALFLRNACIISSINMASFFTQLCLADNVADYWTYDSGESGKLRNCRMVQGNRESPAIT